MRTNIVIDDQLIADALRLTGLKTKKEAVEAGLRMLARQAAYREILKWEGKLKWEGDESIDWTRPAVDDANAPQAVLSVEEPRAEYGAQKKAQRRAGR